MIGVAHGHCTQAVLARPTDRLVNRTSRNHLANAVMTIHHRDGTCVDLQGCLRDGLHGAGLQPGVIPPQAQQPMGLMPPQVRLHQRVGSQPGIVRRNTRALVDGCGKRDQGIRIKAFRVGVVLTGWAHAQSRLFWCWLGK